MGPNQRKGGIWVNGTVPRKKHLKKLERKLRQEEKKEEGAN